MANRIIQNIVGGSHKSDVNKVCRALSVNLYPETQDPSQASSPQILRSILGTEAVVDIGENRCRGLYRVSRGYEGKPALYAAFGNSVYLVYLNEESQTYAKYKVGTISNGNDVVRMTETGGYGDAYPHLIVVDGQNVFAVGTTLPLAEQSADWRPLMLPKRKDGDFIKPTHCAYLYGYLAVNDAGTDAFYLSYLYPFEMEYNGGIDYDVFQTEERWGLDGKGFAVYSEWMPDNTLAICSNSSYLWTFGSRSFQCFSHNNDVNYPFTSPDNAAAAIGIRAPSSLAQLGTMVFWLGASDIGQNGIYISEGTSAIRISNPDMEREISNMTHPEDALGQCWQENQHIFYAITFVSDNKTYVYDVSEKLWHNRESYNGNYWRPQFACFFDNMVVFGSLSDSKLIKLSPNKWTEWDGTLIQRKRIGGVVYSDYSPFYIDCLRLILNNGQIKNVNLENPQCTIRYTWDGSTWSEPITGCVGKTGQYDYNTDFWQLGMGSFFSVEVNFTEDEDFTIISAKINPSGANIF